ncbi:Hpt domain-containing response regulator [Acidipila rosea]|uniref:Response regulator receiver domain-containing protein n=1 Tax=Acidipila rosea TaxID=768535 RepID=A0A4R1LD63_9BACT|nr:Hpt domain-containing protein [Acidipila rosea]MBW4027537.1 response regulator [Acidobacteriota bacterium]TCK75440.1 response regulator receiver domain-containing protein [Acidipila rosea]
MDKEQECNTVSGASISAIATILIIDDDPLSLALVALQVEAAGYSVLTASSGEEALHQLHSLPRTSFPTAFLIDMQMPGLAGKSLAGALRILTGAATLLLAMSASGDSIPDGYDGFLRKPLDLNAFTHALAKPGQPVPGDSCSNPAEVLRRETYDKLAAMMRHADVREIYTASVNDTRTRLEAMRSNAQTGNLASVRAAAHAIKGGAGMIGATQLSGIAARIELQNMNNEELTQALDQLAAACNELERVLDGE